jgi:protein phosphatase
MWWARKRIRDDLRRMMASRSSGVDGRRVARDTPLTKCHQKSFLTEWTASALHYHVREPCGHLQLSSIVTSPTEDTAVFPVAEEFADSFFAPARANIPISFGAASHVGKVRPRNEDHFAIFRRKRSNDVLLSSLPPDDLAVGESHSYAMVVADGMGGMKSGEYASRLALQSMVELAGQATSWVMKFTSLDAQQLEQRVDSYVKRVHTTLQEHGKLDPHKANMGTTWTSAHFIDGHVMIVHIGDSRAYLLREGVLRQITRDETMAQTLIDAGLDPDSVKKFRHILINSLGAGNDTVRATVMPLELLAGDQYLLCTDGLSDMVSDEEIAAVLKSMAVPQDACDRLIELALEHGGRDNATAVLASTVE